MKNVEKKRFMAKAFSLMLAGSVIAGSYACTWAATTSGDGTADAEVALTKNFMMPEGVTQPAASFEFSYTKDGIVTGETGVNSTVSADSTQPNLTALDSENDIAYEAGLTASGQSNGKDVYVKTIDNIVPDASEFAHAGEYVYTITETAETNDSIDDSMTYSQAEYKMHVFVKNTSDGLLVAGASVYQTLNDKGETGANAKVDLDDSSLIEGSGNDFAFTNLYAPEEEQFSISNTVEGDYADLTKEFTVNITLNNPATCDATTYKAVIVDASTKKPVAAESIEFTEGTGKDVTLLTNQELIFIKSSVTPAVNTAITAEDGQCVPAGLTYTLTTAAATDYTHKATITHGGTEEGQVTGTAGKALTINENTIVDTGANGVELVSEYHSIAITGLIIRLLPAVIMLLIAAIGLAISSRDRKRV